MTNLKPYIRPADNNFVVYLMRLLQGNHNMFCDINIFSATTTAEALLFSIQEVTIVECSGHVQVKVCVVCLCKKIFVWLFHAKTKFCLFFRGRMCVIIFFLSSVSATKTGCFVTASETISVIFAIFPLLEEAQ